MRLVQLARLLQISPSLLEDFLKHRNAVFAGAHSRLADEDITAAVIHFAPEKLRDVLAAKDTEEEVQQESAGQSSQPAATGESQPNSDLPQSESSTGVVGSSESDTPGIEVIRAPKVELPGLRVVGKIELPEPVKRETTEAGREHPARTGKPPRQTVDRREDRHARKRESSKNPIQEQRERERRQAEEKRMEEARQAKERRTLAYVKQQSQREQKPTLPKSRHKVKQESGTKPVKPVQRPTSWLGRFWRWLAHGE